MKPLRKTRTRATFTSSTAFKTSSSSDEAASRWRPQGSSGSGHLPPTKLDATKPGPLEGPAAASKHTASSSYSDLRNSRSRAAGSFINSILRASTASRSAGFRLNPSEGFNFPAVKRGWWPERRISPHHRITFSPHWSAGIKLILVLFL